jgi:CMP-2-keto-3-deoxyoctulosonic acid synthetase
MDYAYSPIQSNNKNQRIIIYKQNIKPYLGKRIIKSDNKNKILLRNKQQFINSISENKLNKLLTTKNKIVVKYENENNILYFTIIGNKITYKYVIDELYKQGLNLIKNDQDHIFIEDLISNDDYTFDIVIGS